MRSKQSVSAARLEAFKKKIRRFYKAHGRDLPWRHTNDPYRILVSEFMLQQTQASRVIPKYKVFMKKYGTIRKLGDARTKDLLITWQGLGYNRRALFLKRAAVICLESHKGRIPDNVTELEKLPGVGPYTARAILAFAFNRRSVFIETNIRSVFIHEFFKDADKVDDQDILVLVEKTLPRKGYGDWYAALMDYGAMLKETVSNPSRKSKLYLKQKPFKGSSRQARGEIIRLLIKKSRSMSELQSSLGNEKAVLVEALAQEGFLRKRNGRYSLVV